MEELDSIILSLKNVAVDKSIDYHLLRDAIYKEAHLNFKQNFTRTLKAASTLSSFISGPDDPKFKKMFLRVLQEGKWDVAKTYAGSRPQKLVASKPWAVLVTGLNGIRKTSSINSSFFQKVLYEALESQIKDTGMTQEDLPDGTNSFFRQLDFIVATVANEEFKKLYDITGTGTLSLEFLFIYFLTLYIYF